MYENGLVGLVQAKIVWVTVTTSRHDMYYRTPQRFSINTTGRKIPPRNNSLILRLSTRNAITLLRLKGAPSSVVNRALERAEQLDQQRKRVGQADVG